MSLTIEDVMGPKETAMIDPYDPHVIYRTSIGLMAFSASGDPDLKEKAEKLFNFLLWAQMPYVPCNATAHVGGWRYTPDRCDSDNSNSGYATLALGYGQAGPPFGFGFTIPPSTTEKLKVWLRVMQDLRGGNDDGASFYSPLGYFHNILKNGNLLYKFTLVGYPVEQDEVKRAIGYIQWHWDYDGNCGYAEGWQNHRQAMFTMMKGLEVYDIKKIVVHDLPVDIDWFSEVAHHLLTKQQSDGSWLKDCYGDPVLSTTWALLTLEHDVPKPCLLCTSRSLLMSNPTIATIL
jgi:hypothetical protein